MDPNIVTNSSYCNTIMQSLLADGFIYYSHIPTALMALALGFFVFLKSRKDLAVRLFFLATLLFVLWSGIDLILWSSPDSRKTMFFWSLINFVENLVTVFTLYFAYVFIEKKDIGFKLKVLFASLFLPYIFLLPSVYNITGFDAIMCEANQGSLVKYFYFLEILFLLTLIVYLVRKIISTKGEEKKKVAYFSVGVILFLSSFSGANLAGSLAALLNPSNPDNWKIIQYGLFGMPVFMGFLVYIIVKYKAFHIKLLEAQTLIVAQIILIASMLTFASSVMNRTLIGVTLLLTAIMGWNLVRSVKKEIALREALEVSSAELVGRKEELQMMADRLSASNDQLRSLDNAKSEFISIASHQLRTPLTSIKGFLSLLLEGSYGSLAEKHLDVLNKVYISNERLIALVEDLLNVSRIESGRMEFSFDKWDLDKICHEVMDTFAIRAKNNELYLEYLPPETPVPEVTIDGVKVREVISNMVDNALKYTLKGHGGVKLILQQAGDFARITVADTGIGIPKTELPYLFAKFSRGKDTSRLNTGGTGLGLYVGRSMIESNGGKIWAESDGQDRGSRFIIEIPLVQSEELLAKWE